MTSSNRPIRNDPISLEARYGAALGAVARVLDCVPRLPRAGTQFGRGATVPA